MQPSNTDEMDQLTPAFVQETCLQELVLISKATWQGCMLRHCWDIQSTYSTSPVDSIENRHKNVPSWVLVLSIKDLLHLLPEAFLPFENSPRCLEGVTLQTPLTSKNQRPANLHAKDLLCHDIWDDVCLARSFTQLKNIIQTGMRW